MTFYLKLKRLPDQILRLIGLDINKLILECKTSTLCSCIPRKLLTQFGWMLKRPKVLPCFRAYFSDSGNKGWRKHVVNVTLGRISFLYQTFDTVFRNNIYSDILRYFNFGSGFDQQSTAFCLA